MPVGRHKLRLSMNDSGGAGAQRRVTRSAQLSVCVCCRRIASLLVPVLSAGKPSWSDVLDHSDLLSDRGLAFVMDVECRSVLVSLILWIISGYMDFTTAMQGKRRLLLNNDDWTCWRILHTSYVRQRHFKAGRRGKFTCLYSYNLYTNCNSGVVLMLNVFYYCYL